MTTTTDSDSSNSNSNNNNHNGGATYCMEDTVTFYVNSLYRKDCIQLSPVVFVPATNNDKFYKAQNLQKGRPY